ncbi:MAG: hypothetical protein JW818_16885 [Pirellulales bacterium]|nr:hypothetical protein [Pirellulales bacterium]
MRVRCQLLCLTLLVTLVGSMTVAAEPMAPAPLPAGQWAAPNYEPGCGQPYVQPCDQQAMMATDWANSMVGKAVHMVIRDTKRNRCWPEPFVCPDRQAVRSPFVAMVAKGWIRQNTLGEHHFEPETGKLTYAGILRVRKILLEGPPQHRTIYVHRSLNPKETAARVDAVQQLASETVRTGELPPVLETNLPAPGWPAEQVDAVGRRYRDSIPLPRLPEASSGGEDSSSGGQ